MATVRWRGDAPAISQIQSWSFGGTWESSDLIRVTIGGKTKDFTAGSTTTATVVANFVSAWNALSAATWPELIPMRTRSGTFNDMAPASRAIRSRMTNPARTALRRRRYGRAEGPTRP